MSEDKKEDKKLNDFANQLFKVELGEQVLPEFKPQRGKDWIKFGKDNKYPEFLIDLLNRGAEHGPIVLRKRDWLYGKGLKYIQTGDPKQDAKIEAFLGRANRFQTWNEIIFSICTNLEVYNGYPLQFIYGKNGKIVDVYSLDASRIRPSICEKFYYYCEDWSVRSPENDNSFKKYPAYNENIKTGSCIYYYIVNRPSANLLGNCLPIPEYASAIAAIETDINIDIFHFSNSTHGMTAALLITFFNGMPTDEAKRKIKEMFESKYTGPNKAGSILFNFVNEGQKGVETTQLAQAELDKQFEVLGKRLLQKIFSGHSADPVLFGIDNATSWTRSQILEKWDKFLKTYIELRRLHIFKALQIVAKTNAVAIGDIYFENNDPIGQDIAISESTLKDVLNIDELRNYIKDKKGIELTEDTEKNIRLNMAQKLGTGNTALLIQIVESAAPPEQKLGLLVKVFGIKDITARQILNLPLPIPVAMSKEKDKILQYLLTVGVKGNDDEILEEKYIDFDSSGKAIEFEAAIQIKYADILGTTVKEVRNQILDLLAGDPFIDPKIIAKQLGTDVGYVNEQIKELIKSKILEASGNGFNITEKGLNRAENVEPVIDTEIYTVYKYAVRPGLGKPIIKTSREYCIDLINADLEYTREQLDGMENEEGQNAWVYRGGYYTTKGTNDTTPYCRHIWKAITKKRRINA